jgi:hypothetical protein
LVLSRYLSKLLPLWPSCSKNRWTFVRSGAPPARGALCCRATQKLVSLLQTQRKKRPRHSKNPKNNHTVHNLGKCTDSAHLSSPQSRESRVNQSIAHWPKQRPSCTVRRGGA